MLRHFHAASLVALMLAVLALGGCKDDEEATATPAAPATSVTLSGAMQVAAAPAAAGLSERLLSANPADYVLYCVTFSTPPQSGSGSFDASGNFSVTVAAAAGLPIGCFINDAATNATVSTITFQLGSGGLAGTAGSVSLAPGAYTVTIKFDPASGVATVDVSQTAQAPAAARFQPGTLVGTWRMTCVDTTPTSLCLAMLETPPATPFVDLYFDVITATEGGKALYALGVWGTRQAFIDGGATEGIPAAAIPATITGVKSLNADVTAPVPSATGKFLGFVSQPGYDALTNRMSGNDTLAALTALDPVGKTYAYDPTFNDPSLQPGDPDGCVVAPPDLATPDGRKCLLRYLQFLGDAQPPKEDAVTRTMPRLTGDAEWNFALNGTSGADLIQFGKASVGGSPAIVGRFALMGMEAVGDSGVAQDFRQFPYTRADPSTGTPLNCRVSEELTIAMTVTGAATASGRFSERVFDSCDTSRARFGTFDVTFAKQ